MGDIPKTRWYRICRFWYKREDRILQAFCLVAGAFILAMLLSGCATFDYEWRQTRPESIKPWLYVEALDADLACRGIGAQASRDVRINGCAQWHPVGCLIILPPNAPDWLIEHERHHCKGFTHE